MVCVCFLRDEEMYRRLYLEILYFSYKIYPINGFI